MNPLSLLTMALLTLLLALLVVMIVQRRTERRVRRVLQGLPVGVIAAEVDAGSLVFANERFCQMLGYPYEQLKGMTPADLHPASDSDRVLIAFKKMMRGEIGFAPDMPVLRRDGSVFLADIHSAAIELDGRACNLAVFTDMTERNQAEAARRASELRFRQAAEILARQQEELMRSNAELEQFAYLISHDLRQPLRMVKSYVQLLEQQLAGQLDDDAREMMYFATDGAARMDQMLVSLLEYSRVGRKGEPMTPLDSRAVLDEALAFLEPAIAEAGATVCIEGDWPTIVASRDEWSRLFQNLIGNALKYRAPGRTPRITVSVAPDGEGWRFGVADNGIGIAPAQLERIFGVFQRLHTREEYEGLGIGLAISRKIVERHGGRLWAESAGEGQGSQFRFTLRHTTLPEESA